MKSFLSRILLILADGLSLYIAIFFALFLRDWLADYFLLSPPKDMGLYLKFTMLYAITIILFCSQGIYRNRFDFWQELGRIIKGLFFSIVIILSVLAMTKQVEDYSRFVLIASFVLAALIIPLQKNILKRTLFRIGWWRKRAAMIGKDRFFSHHVFTNPYLGYIPSSSSRAKTLFIATTHSKESIEQILHKALLSGQEVIFVPTIKNFDFSDAHIIHLFNARSNLIIVNNNLLSPINRLLKSLFDYLLALSILPLLILLMGFIVWKIKREDGGKIFFQQTRLGERGKTFECYKFRSMSENSDGLLGTYLAKHPQEIRNYEIYHKYENDPRITRIGKLLRKTSLDELPQIINVLKGEMSLIGPRPYMVSEKEAIGNDTDMILAVKPGITGLWQVSGRSDVDFSSRVEMDVWYVRNWNIWSDIIILLKTIQTVLGRKGST